MSREALLAGFLMIWLKKCVVPSHPHEVVLPSVVLPAAQLVGRRPLALLPAMMGSIHSGLNQIITEFLKGASNPRVELPYSYLMAWLALHCPSSMETPRASFGPSMAKLEGVGWSFEYLYNIRQILKDSSSYEVFRCLLSIPGAELDEDYEDVPSATNERLTSLSPSLFIWLVNIRPVYLVWVLDDRVLFEPYIPSHFAGCLGYDQLYVGNPNVNLRSGGSLLDAARSSFWSMSGCTGAKFRLPS